MSEVDAETRFVGGGVYSNTEIMAAIGARHIVCYPFNSKHVNTSSVDVTLGHHYYATDRDSLSSLYNPFDEENVANYFGEPQRAVPFKQLKIAKSVGEIILLRNIPPDHPVIVLRPDERILGHTHEFIGIKPPGTSSMQARSTLGRNGISSCLDAGWGDSGYINRWTLEIQNQNPDKHIVLPVGERIAQIVFFHTGPVSGEYFSDTGKYQADSSDDLDSIIANWRPEMMLPKAYKDSRQIPAPIDGLADGLK